MRSEHGEVLYLPPYRDLALRVAEVLDREYERVGRGVGYEGKAPVRAFLAPSEEAFDRLTSGRVPDWGKGCALPAYGVIVLQPFREGPGDLGTTLAHEVSHVLLHRAVGGKPLPRWFDEGVAMWYALEWGRAQSFRLALASLLGRLVPLEEVDEVLSFSSERAEMAYAESFSAVVFLLSRYGGDSVRRVTKFMREGDSFPEALSRTTGLSYHAFLEEWRSYVRRKYNIVLVLSEGPYLWVGVALLFILVYMVKRRKAKRIEEEWEEEEGWEID